MANLTHLDEKGHVRMVDVSPKESTLRAAVAQGSISMTSATLELIGDQAVKKGNVLETARIAGIMAAKKTPDLIPMCHPLMISHVKVDFTLQRATNSISIQAEVRCQGPTGVEMEALCAVSTAALTIYDMCKAYDKAMTISDIHLLKKSGGKSGEFVRETP